MSVNAVWTDISHLDSLHQFLRKSGEVKVESDDALFPFKTGKFEHVEGTGTDWGVQNDYLRFLNESLLLKNWYF